MDKVEGSTRYLVKCNYSNNCRKGTEYFS